MQKKRFDQIILILRRFKDKLKAFVTEYDFQILLIIFSLLPISIVWCSDYDIKAKVLFTIGIVLCVVTLLLKLSIKILELQLSASIPVLKSRLTHNDDGKIYVNDADIELGVLYLYEIENFIERNNLRG